MKRNQHGSLGKLAEDEDDRETQRQIKESVRKWGRATWYLGLALTLSVGAWSLFFAGHSLHRLWQTWGRVLAVTSGCIFFPLLYAAGTTFNLWWYGRSLRKITRDFARGEWSKWDR